MPKDTSALWDKVRNALREKNKSKFETLVRELIRRLNSEDGTTFIKKLIEEEFADFRSRLDKDKPLVLIITTHGKAINRERTFSNRLRELAKSIKTQFEMQKEEIEKKRKILLRTLKKGYQTKFKKKNTTLKKLKKISTLGNTIGDALESAYKRFFKNNEHIEMGKEECQRLEADAAAEVEEEEMEQEEEAGAAAEVEEEEDDEEEMGGSGGAKEGVRKRKREDTDEESKKFKVTYIKANRNGLCQQFSPKDAATLQKDITNWYKNGNFDPESISKLSKELKDKQFREFHLGLSNAIESDTLDMFLMKYGPEWKVGSEQFSSTENIQVKPEFDKYFYLRADEVYEYNYTDMLIHVVDKEGKLMAIPWLFSDLAHLFGGAVANEDRTHIHITYSRLLKLVFNFNEEVVSIEFACDTPGPALVHNMLPQFIDLGHREKRRRTVGGTNKKGKTRRYKKGKTRKCNPPK